jgi:hypothetical protein
MIKFLANVPWYINFFVTYGTVSSWVFVYIVSSIVGVYGLFYALRQAWLVLRGWTVIDSYNELIEGGRGKSTWVMEQIESAVKQADIPVSVSQQLASPSIFSQKETYLVVAHYRLKAYRMYIRARDFGIYLDVSWFLTVEPRFLQRTFAKLFRRNPRAASMKINFANQQDLIASTTVIHQCVIRVAKTLLEELDQDPSRLDTTHKGFLSVW